LAALQAYELGTFLQGLLHCEDRVSMAWGLESRLPLLDWRLAEGLFAMTPRARTAGYELKGLLRAAAAPYLPGSVVNRRDKLGFPTPFRLWAEQDLRQPIRELLGDSFLVRDGIIDRKFLEHQLAAPGYSDMAGLTLWAMVATETWHNVFF
ncbi:MAG: asparagine synthase-related protein, partial [Lentisphaeria bacterium]|nr:asparagine synthase-related protein [Lentisphaeria bacterium]